MNRKTSDAAQGQASSQESKRKGGRKHICRLDATNHTSSSRGEEAQKLAAGQRPAQTLGWGNTEQEQEPVADGDLGVSRNINDAQPNADVLELINAVTAMLPAFYERAKQTLAACESAHECKDWLVPALALFACGRMAEDTKLQLQIHALRIAGHASERAWKLLEEASVENGGRPPCKEQSGGHSPKVSDVSLEPDGKPKSARAAAARPDGTTLH
jgi:hypothetical protein